MKPNQRKILVFSIIAILVVGYIAFTPIQIAGAKTSGSNSAEASTPYGESIGIKIGSGSSTSAKASVVAIPVSWLASYSDQDSQNVYDVNGTYKSQEQVTLSYTLAVTHASVTSITATVKIKAIDNADASYYEYTIANAKALNGASPINDNGEVVKTIATHLSEITASATSATVKYEIYCQVTATGSVSGETLTATVAYTKFGALVYTRTSESSDAEVTPQVSVASWLEHQQNSVKYRASVIDDTIGIPEGWTIKLVALASVTVAAMVVKRRWL